jgi:hypothetical protein
MDRREAIRRTAFLMGSAVSAPTLMGILQGCSTKPNLDWKPTFFNEDQAYVVSQIAEIYIPQTDTPGAKQIGVPAFIEQLVSLVYDEETKLRFMTGLDQFMQSVDQNTGDAFADLELDKQAEQVRIVHDSDFKKSPRPFIMLMKELTLLGFFTSETGATEVLQFEAVPGAFQGCKPLSEVGGKTWATG